MRKTTFFWILKEELLQQEQSKLRIKFNSVNGICGFSRGSSQYDEKKANYLFEMENQFVIDVKIIQKNLALLCFPYMFKRSLKKFFYTTHHNFFSKKISFKF